AAAGRVVHRVPRHVLSAEPIVVADHGAHAGVGITRPVVARVGERGALGQPAVRVRARQDVVLVRLVADALHLFAALVEGRRLADVVAVALVVAVQVRDILSDQHTLGVVPGTRADAVARVHGRPAVLRRRAQVGAPRAVARTDGRGKRLAMLVGAFEAAVVRAVTAAHAGHEESHGLLLTLPLAALSEHGTGRQQAGHDER